MANKKNPEEPVTETAEAPDPKKKGRPQIQIDKNNFEYLVSCGCTLKMIAGYFALNLGSCSEDTIERWCKREYNQSFAEVSRLRKEGGKGMIRAKQQEIALAGSEKMLIWLGKTWLGQSENGPKEEATEKTSKLYEVLDKDDDEEGDEN